MDLVHILLRLVAVIPASILLIVALMALGDGVRIEVTSKEDLVLGLVLLALSLAAIIAIALL